MFFIVRSRRRRLRCVYNPNDKHTWTRHTARDTKHTQTHTEREFYRMMKKLFHFYCSFGSVKQTRLWTTKSKEKRKEKKKSLNSKKFVCLHCIPNVRRTVNKYNEIWLVNGSPTKPGRQKLYTIPLCPTFQI